MTGLRALAALLAATALGTAACTPGDAAPSPGPVTPRTLTVISDAPPVTDWDPATAGSDSSGGLDNIYETLTRYDPVSHQIAPLLATDWQPNRDSTVWRFSLREGVRFHSGRPMDARAVRASILDSARRSPASAWHDVRSVTTPNDGTVAITLSRPLPLPDLAAADHGAFIYDVRAAGAAPGRDGGTGPYRVASRKPDAATPLTLTRVPGYWGGWKNGQFTGVTFAVEHDGRAAARRLRAHGSSIALRLPPRTWAGLRGEEGVQTSQATSWQVMFALLDTRRLHDRRLRQAIACAIDDDAVVGALHGALTKATGVVPEGLYGHFVDLPLAAYDPARARRLASGAHQRLTIRYAAGPGLGDVARRIAGDLGKAGMRAEVRDERPEAGAQDIAVVDRRPAAPDPYALFAGTFGTGAAGNLSRYSSRPLDRLLAGVRATAAGDKDAAAQVYRRAQQILLTDVPAVPLGTRLDQRAFRTDFVGYADDPAYPDVVFAYDLTSRAT